MAIEDQESDFVLLAESTSPGGNLNTGTTPAIMFNRGLVVALILYGAGIASGKVRLIKAGVITIDPNTPKDDLVAAECDFSGYPAGGIAPGGFNKQMASGNGYATFSNMAVFAFVTPTTGDPVTNTVGGWWYEDGSSHDPQCGGNFDTPVPMVNDQCAIPIVISIGAQPTL